MPDPDLPGPPNGSVAARRPSRVAPSLVVVSAAVMAALLLAELLVRLCLPPPERVTVTPTGDLDRRLAAENADPKTLSYRGAVNALFEKTPTGRRMRANTTVVIENHYLSHRTITLRTNSLGFRGPELGPKTTTRVLFLGDSITLAHYQPEEETFVRLVETLSRDPGPPLETVNAGVGGVGLEAELAVLKETGLRADPDVVVLDFYLNDVQESPGVFLLHVPRSLQWSWVAWHLARGLPQIWSREKREIDPEETGAWLAGLRRDYPAAPGDPSKSREAFNALIQENVGDWGSAWCPGAWRRLEPLLAEFRRQADLHRFTLLIVGFPVEPQVSTDLSANEPQRRLAQVAERLQVPYLDLLPILREARRRGAAPLFYDQCHHTPEGSRLIAPAVLEFLRAHPPKRHEIQ